MMTNKTPHAIIRPRPSGRWEVRYVNFHKTNPKAFYAQKEALLFKTQFLNSRAMDMISEKSNLNWGKESA